MKFKHKLHTIQLNNIFIIRFAWTQTNRNIVNKTAILSENNKNAYHVERCLHFLHRILKQIYCAPDISRSFSPNQSQTTPIARPNGRAMGVFCEVGSVTQVFLSKLLCSVQYRIILYRGIWRVYSILKYSSWYYDMVDIVFASWQTFSFLLACIDFNISMDK